MTDLSFDFWYPGEGGNRPDQPDAKGEFEAILTDLEAVGFKPNPMTAPFRPDYLAAESAGKYPAWLIGWNCDWLSIDNFLYTAFFGYRDGKPNPEFAYKNDAMNQAMVDALSTGDTAVQAQKWGEAQDFMAADLPSVPIVSAKTAGAYSRQGQGFRPFTVPARAVPERLAGQVSPEG